MTIDELKAGIADVIEHPENADTLVEKIGTDLTALDVAKQKIDEQTKELESKDKTIRAYIDKTLLGRKIEQSEPEKKKEPGIDWDKFFVTDDDKEAK